MSPYDNMAEDARDAARYRWLRRVIGPGERTAEWFLLTGLAKQAPDTPEGFDSAVDAAMQALPLGVALPRAALAEQIKKLPDGIVAEKRDDFLRGFAEGHKSARLEAAALVTSGANGPEHG
jgi:hypothetical protein